MKTCSYCGKQYPDDAAACAVDGQPLTGSSVDRSKVTGVWRGVYGFEKPESMGNKAVPFTLKLKQGWLAHFIGTVVDDVPPGMPGTGTIDGYFGSPKIEFTKQMPVGYVTRPDGSTITLRESLVAQGHVCKQDFPHPPIFYEGTFLDTNRVQGTWIVRATPITLPDGTGMTVPQTSGIWSAQFITSDMNATPAGAPKEPFFDKSLLPEGDAPTEAQANEDSGFRSMGKFGVADAEELLKRFEQENIRFEINRDDSSIRQMMPFTAITGGYSGTAPMIEIYVHPEDEARAVEIMGEDNKI